jgi:hypothetical protein
MSQQKQRTRRAEPTFASPSRRSKKREFNTSTVVSSNGIFRWHGMVRNWKYFDFKLIMHLYIYVRASKV